MGISIAQPGYSYGSALQTGKNEGQSSFLVLWIVYAHEMPQE